MAKREAHYAYEKLCTNLDVSVFSPDCLPPEVDCVRALTLTLRDHQHCRGDDGPGLLRLLQLDGLHHKVLVHAQGSEHLGEGEVHSSVRIYELESYLCCERLIDGEG